MALLWCTEALPLAVTALLPIVLFPLMGIMEASEVSTPIRRRKDYREREALPRAMEPTKSHHKVMEEARGHERGGRRYSSNMWLL